MKRISDQFEKFIRLPEEEQRLIFVAVACLPVFWVGLYVFGLPRFQVWLQRLSPMRMKKHPYLSQIQAWGEAVNIGARLTPFPATCLTRSLLLGWLLQRRGVPSDLRIGVRLKEGTLDAHAWVECDGVPVNDRPNVASQFAPFGDLVPLAAFDLP